MLTRINKRLRQQEGFTLMELMIVVVILGILMAIAIPVYNGVQERARKAVAEANVTMLNRGIKTLEALGYDEDDIIFDEQTEYDGNKEDHLNALEAYLGVELDNMEYVEWNSEEKKYVVTPM